MENITIVKIIRPEKYKNLPNIYGILVQSMNETAVVNFDSNMGGTVINIAHSDYSDVLPNCWDVYDGQVFITECCGYIPTGLKILQ